MSGKYRLTEWALWKLEPGFCVPIKNPMERIKEDRENAGAGGGEFHYDMIEVDGESVACMPDGGVGEMVERMAKAIERDRRCREIDELVVELRYGARDFWNLVDVTFSGTHPKDVMKGPLVSARILGIGLDSYRERIRAVYQWIEKRTGEQTKGSKRQDERQKLVA